MSQLQDFPTASIVGDTIADLDWRCGPCGQTRDSDVLERANFDAACEALYEADPELEDTDIVRFGHWACGWVEEIFTRPGSAAEVLAISLKEKLQVHPVLDEELLEEYKEAIEAEATKGK